MIGSLSGIPILEIFMTSVSLAVSAIPEGLPAVVTIVLAIGMQQMASQHAIVKNLPAVETLGSASIICSDKTGTLTQNRMTLMQVYDVSDNLTEEITDHNSTRIKEILKMAVLCCNGTIHIQGETIQQIGDPTETCIVYVAYLNGYIKENMDSMYTRIGEIPFDSERKCMTTICTIEGDYIVITKGGFDVLAEKCIAGNLEAGKEVSEKMSRNALRVLGVGFKRLNKYPKKEEMSAESLECGLTFAGLLGMMDPPREEVCEAAAVCKRAGIKPVMITGDHIITAIAIATKIGIFGKKDKAMTGTELDLMEDKLLSQQIENISVYARVSPHNKIRIVKAWQQKGHVVAMTGDGVNDAPALKAADIGCAMGITGTEVSKGAADIILTDDNFSTIVYAIKAGRGIFSNIRKSVCYLIGTNIGEILTVFLIMMVWHFPPLLSMQLLWINLVTDSFPAIALGMEKVDDDIMEQEPKAKSDGIFSKGLRIMLITQGIMFSMLSMLGFYIIYRNTNDIAMARTETFLILSLVQIVQAYNMRSHHSLFKIGWHSNSFLNRAAALSVFLVVIVLWVPPFRVIF